MTKKVIISLLICGAMALTSCTPLKHNMVFVQGGSFQMGDLLGDSNWITDYSSVEKKVHTVILDDFYISQYELSQAEWNEVYPSRNPSHFLGGNLPVGGIDWYDAVEFCNELSKKEGLESVYLIEKDKFDYNNTNSSDQKMWLITQNLKANGYRLPTEAEWEYAARARGQKIRFGNGSNEISPETANFDPDYPHKVDYVKDGIRRAVPVAVDSFGPNALGIYNMSGNMWEWCWDWYGIESYDGQEGVKNPTGLKGGALRVLRGGAYWNSGDFCRNTQRFQSDTWDNYPYFGVRLVRSKI